MTSQKPFKIKLHPPLDEKTADRITKDTLEAIGDQLTIPPLSQDDIGKNIKGEGIYLGTYAPVDRDGVSLKKVFNVFAAPENLFIEKNKLFPRLRKFFKQAMIKRIAIFTYNKAVRHLAGLKNWHGHSGTKYSGDKELYASLRDGTYKGGWIIPTRDILHGRDVDNNKSTPDNILAHKNKGAFQGTFKKALAKTSDYSCWYWSSTEPREDSSSLFAVHFGRNIAGLDKKNSLRLSCRPVRLVPIK